MKKPLHFLVLATCFLIVVSGCGITPPLTPEEVIDSGDEWLNKTVAVQGMAGTLWMSCTEEECTPEYPCCNACWGSLALYPDAEAFSQAPSEGPYAYQGNGPAIGLEFPNGEGCKGNMCEVTCEPLQMGERYIVTGVLRECSDWVSWCLMSVEDYEHE